jgi:hypothetical protein
MCFGRVMHVEPSMSRGDEHLIEILLELLFSNLTENYNFLLLTVEHILVV